jgi:MoaA/NifB/PqqE/SkfB family radical SAM enzyme
MEQNFKKITLGAVVKAVFARLLPKKFNGAIRVLQAEVPVETAMSVSIGTNVNLETESSSNCSVIDNSLRQYRSCHINELFINSKGEVYPCCRVWTRSDMLIGYISDSDILEKIHRFSPPECACNKYVIRKATPDEAVDYKVINIELSLACQAKCAMCCVNAPEWKGSYDCYQHIIALISKLACVDAIVVQGGEVLIQSESLKFVEQLKKITPKNTCFRIVSNANVGTELLEKVESLFDHIAISIVGFQEETYRKIMGIKLDKTIKFAEALIARQRIRVTLKFLLTPLSFHEVNLFLNWALNLAPVNVTIYDSGFRGYINENTEDKYWLKIIDRTIMDVKKELQQCNIDKLKVNNTVIYIQNLNFFEIDNNFIVSNGLDGIIKEYDT